MTDRAHILVLPTWYPNSRRPDYAVFFRVQTKALQRAGAKVGVIFPELREVTDLGGIASILDNRFQVSHEATDGYPVIRWHGWRVPKMRNSAAKMFADAAHRLFKMYVAKHGRPDLILAHTAVNAGWAAKTISEAENLPFVLVEHSTHFARNFYNADDLDRARKAFHAAAAVYAVSEPFAQLLSGMFGLSVKYAPNAIDTAFFAPEGQRAPFRFDRPARIGFVGTLDAKKGVDVLIRAIAKLTLPAGAELRLIGEGPSQGVYHRLAGDLGIASQVKFLGHARQSQVKELMLWSDVFVLPSRFETFGVVAIEALATGAPVVATRSGGPESIITERFLGQLVPPGDAGALANAIHAELEALGMAPMDIATKRNIFVAQNFGADACAQRFLAALQPHVHGRSV